MLKLSLKVLGLPLVLLVGIFLSIYAYIQSSHFRVSVSDTLSNVLGESVELGQDLEVLEFYPRIRMSLPNARLRASEQFAGVRRARLQNLQVSIDRDVLLSGGSEGEVRVSADNLTVITESDLSGSASASKNENKLSTVNASSMSMAEQLASVKAQLKGLDIALNIAEFDYYARDSQNGNTVYRFSNLALSSLYGDSIEAHASMLESEDVVRQFEMSVLSDADQSDADDKLLSGTVDLIANDKQHGVAQMQGRWTLQQDDLILDALELKAPDALLRGKATIAFATPEISIDSDLELRKFTIKTAEANEEASVTTPEQRLFPYDVFATDIDKNLTADIRLNLGAVRLDEMPVINGLLHLKLLEGVLDVSSEELYLLGGKTDFSLQVDNSLAQIIGFNLKLQADDIQLERIRSLGDDDTIMNRGNADAIVALRGSGPSPGHIASTLDGYVIATVKAAQIKQKYSTLMDVGVVSWAVDKLSLLSKGDDARRGSANLSDPLSIDCASLRLYINDGRVEVSNGAIIELQDNVLYSSGYVDLKSETMGFAFRTKSRSIFDWSAISIAKYAEIGGSLSAPAITLNAKELAKQGVLSASSVAWGPLPSLVYSLAESGVKNMNSVECTPEID